MPPSLILEYKQINAMHCTHGMTQRTTSDKVMKDFFKNVAATVVGIFVSIIALIIFGLISVVGMIASSSTPRSVANNSVLVLNLSGTIEEQGEENIFGELTGNAINNLGLNDILAAIKNAKEESRIKGIYIEAGTLEGSYATLEEIRNALTDFRTSKKWVVAYGDTYSQGAYYVATAADKIWLNPKGMVDWHGLGAQTAFMKDLYAKFGVKYQVVKVGKFKSYTEVYTEGKMSNANREQVSAFVNGTWKNIVQKVASSRKIKADTLNAYADRLVTFEPAENLKKYKMVDELVYADKVKGKIKTLLGLDEDATIAQLGVRDVRSLETSANKGDEIAVYYAYGSIVQNGASQLFSQDKQIVAQTVCSDLEALMDDDNVKAVVIRVNSGGGDAYASEQLWHQITELKAKKPVVISMGDYAASGAYYMSCPANWIVAQPNTLTGSIGIFAAIPDVSGLITDKLGVKFDEVKTNRNSTFGNVMARPFNDEELSYLQGYVNRGYELFRKRVADGRKQSVENIEKIAQGRVWLGQDALKIHLIDQLGGLDDAINKASQLAKLKEYHTAEYPEVLSWKDQLLQSVSRNSYLDDEWLRLALGSLYNPFMTLRNLNNREMLQAQIPYIVNIR